MLSPVEKAVLRMLQKSSSAESLSHIITLQKVTTIFLTYVYCLIYLSF